MASRPLGAADQLHDHIDIRECRELQRIVMPGVVRKIDSALALAVACRDGDDLQRAFAAARQIAGMSLQQLDGSRADGAEPGNGDA